MKKIVKSTGIADLEKKVVQKINIEEMGELDVVKYKKEKLSIDQKERLNEIIKRVELNSQKGYFDTSKHLIIEGLAIDKFNKDLNLELAVIYEKDENYKHAEYIYKDLIEIYKTDIEIVKKLAYTYAMLNDYPNSLKMYEKVFAKKRSDFDTIMMLADLSYDMQKHKKCLKYTNLYLKEKPRDVDKLLMKAVCLEKVGPKSEAYDTYKRITQLQPYNKVATKKADELFTFR